MDHHLPKSYSSSLHSAYLDQSRLRALSTEMIARDGWPRERLQNYQRQRLAALVRHAVTHSPYYREVIGNPATEDIAPENLPTLTKQTLMKHWDRIVCDPQLRLADAERHLAGAHAREPYAGQYQLLASGGTTGVQGIVAYDPTAWEIAVACFSRATAMQGISPAMKVVGIGSPSPLHMTNRVFTALRAARPEAPKLSVTTPLADIVVALNAFFPDAVVTYPSMIRRLAEEQDAGRLRIAPTKFGSAAETLTGDVRRLARETWGAPVLNMYGATEMGVIATECPWTRGAHVLEDLVLVEVVDEQGRAVPPGVPGHKVLLTNLFNRVLPLIRYEVSDIATIAENSCPCGRTHLRLASVHGRQEDVLKLPTREGGQIRVHALHLQEWIMRIPAIRQFEIAPRAGDLLIRVALRTTADADHVLQGTGQAIERELRRLGAVSRVFLEAVGEIGRSGTGAKEKLVRT